mmetsp:Transcript_20227/g.42150  ORF Transcript_20227/g.42150 Transcript_20227/m.42150 type:complete len:586 (+) Transcript_20227:673-2430(+)
MMYAMMLMIAYVAVVLARRDLVESKVLLGLLIVVNVGLSLGVAFGLCGYLGIPFTQMSMMCIFIIMGVGIDDMFILTDAFDREPVSLAVEDRVGNALGEVGGSITLTSVTDFLAFSIGSMIDLPAVSYFCVTAAIAVLAVFIVQITFFAACLALDARRILSNRYDVLPCILRGSAEVYVERGVENDEKEVNMRELKPKGTPSTIAKFADFLVRPWVSGSVILAFAIVGTVMATSGLTTLKKGIKITDFLPEGSYVGTYFAKRDLYFGEIDTIEVITKATIDPSSPQDRALLESTLSEIEALDFTVGWSSCWYNSWSEWHTTAYSSALDGSTSMSDARASFDAWLATDDAKEKFTNDIILDESVITTSKLQMLFLFSTMDTDKAVVEMYATREAADPSGSGFALAFNQNFLWMERFITIDSLTVNTLLGALAGVFVICLFFLGLSSSLLVCSVVVLINLNIVGLMALWDVRLNVASLVILILSVGFSVDYSAHIAEGYQVAAAKGLPAEAAVKVSVTEMGVSVMNGGVSTLLAVVALSASKSEGFVVLFKMFLGMVTFGLLHGVVLLPVLLLLTGKARDRWCTKAE